MSKFDQIECDGCKTQGIKLPCVKCGELQREYVEALEADAELGRLVRKMKRKVLFSTKDMVDEIEQLKKRLKLAEDAIKGIATEYIWVDCPLT